MKGNYIPTSDLLPLSTHARATNNVMPTLTNDGYLESDQLRQLRLQADLSSPWTSGYLDPSFLDPDRDFQSSSDSEDDELALPPADPVPALRGKVLCLKIPFPKTVILAHNTPTVNPLHNPTRANKTRLRGKNRTIDKENKEPNTTKAPVTRRSGRPATKYGTKSKNTSSVTKKTKEKTAFKKAIFNKKTKPLPLTSLPDGSIKKWCAYGEAGSYAISSPQWREVRDWVMALDCDSVAENVAFHRLVVDMKRDLKLESARDIWVEALPKPEESNYELCVLFLMVCTPLVPDTKIVEIFTPLFADNYITLEWIVGKGPSGIAELLRPLGRQNDSSQYIFEAVITLKGIGRFLRDYRELAQMKGVGPKVAIETIRQCFGLVQGIACDVHMCRIFKALGWIPRFGLTGPVSITSILDGKKEKEHFDYELSRAAVEGWFPRPFWGRMNQTWAGLSQLLNVAEAKRQIATYVDAKVADIDSPWRVADKIKFAAIMSAYT